MASFFNSYFNDTQIFLILFSSVFFLFSIISHLKNKELFFYVFLGLTSICIFSFSALLDPFLNLWDERFHALVAKNLMNEPLMPMLYNDPIVEMAYDRWDRYHIWLHKQPLFLWQIAFSFKIFGISEFSLRLPNVILSTIFVLIIYRSGTLLTNKNVGFIASLLALSTIYLIELIAGRQTLEHNDISFLAYVSLSIWSFIEYYYSKKRIWIYLIGLFSGMAILCKWLVGLLVYFGWFVLRILEKKFKFSENKDIAVSILITLAIALPWQILTFLWYPEEAISAYNFNHLHFTVPIEGHVGDSWYHFDKFDFLYGKLASFLIVPAFFILLSNSREKKLIYALLGMVAVVYLFFCFAATKMPSFPIVVALIIFIAFACFVEHIINMINHFFKLTNLQPAIFTLIIIGIVLFRFDIEFLQEKHTIWNKKNRYTTMLIHNKAVFQSLDLPKDAVLFNIKGRHYIEAMFHTGLPAYNFIPTEEQYRDIKNKGRTIAVFTGNNVKIPSYLKNDTTVISLNMEIQGYK